MQEYQNYTDLKQTEMGFKMNANVPQKGCF